MNASTLVEAFNLGLQSGKAEEQSRIIKLFEAIVEDASHRRDAAQDTWEGHHDMVTASNEVRQAEWALRVIEETEL